MPRYNFSDDFGDGWYEFGYDPARNVRYFGGTRNYYRDGGFGMPRMGGGRVGGYGYDPRDNYESGYAETLPDDDDYQNTPRAGHQNIRQDRSSRPSPTPRQSRAAPPPPRRRSNNNDRFDPHWDPWPRGRPGSPQSDRPNGWPRRFVDPANEDIFGFPLGWDPPGRRPGAGTPRPPSRSYDPRDSRADRSYPPRSSDRYNRDCNQGYQNFPGNSTPRPASRNGWRGDNSNGYRNSGMDGRRREEAGWPGYDYYEGPGWSARVWNF